MSKFVLATANPGKIKDYFELVSPYPNIELIPQTQLAVDEVAETGLTFVENALIKARHAAQVTGLASIGDDSGLVVDALEGAPGLYSARYAGIQATAEENIEKLLDALAQIPNAPRTARFYAVVVLLRSPLDPTPLICEGTWEGEILFEPKGQNGFGYLPIFFSHPHQGAAAELSLQEKTKHSHRGRAFIKLLEKYTHIYAK